MGKVAGLVGAAEDVDNSVKLLFHCGTPYLTISASNDLFNFPELPQSLG